MTTHEKVWIASEAFQQWCSDDAQQELDDYNLRHNTRFSFKDDIEEITPFYVHLYDNGIRL